MLYSPTPFQAMRFRWQYRKPRTTNAYKEGRVYVTITIERVDYGPYSTDILTTKPIFDGRQERHMPPESEQLDNLLKCFKESLLKAADRLKQQNLPLTGPMLMQHRLQDFEKTPLTIVGAIERFLDQKKGIVYKRKAERKSEQISPATFRRMEVRSNTFRRYLTDRRDMARLLIQADMTMIRDYTRWCNDNKFGVAYRSKCIGLLKMILKEAKLDGIIPHNPLDGLRLSHPVETPVLNLTDDEVDALWNAELPEVLRRACDSFLFALECCMHHADFYELRERHVRVIQGQAWVEKVRAKSMHGHELVQHICLSERAQQLIAKYGGLEKIPRLSDTSYSRYLKDVAKFAGLYRNGEPIKLIFSNARDTGIGRLVRQGVADHAICAIAGWTTTKHLRRYAVVDREVVRTALNRHRGGASAAGTYPY